jgi:hypothetical protein
MNVQRYAVLASDICVMFNSVKTVSILIYNVSNRCDVIFEVYVSDVIGR